jgi:ribosomal protein S18 acetylase RimI-like enzyme
LPAGKNWFVKKIKVENMKNIILKRATVDDVDIFLALEKSVAHYKTYSAMVDEDEIKEEFENNYIIYLIKMDDLVVGIIDYKIDDINTAYLSDIVVKPEFQGQGIARQAVENILKEIGDIKRIYLYTHPENVPIRKIFSSFGFTIEGNKGNHFGDGEPRIVMSKIK